MPRFLLALTVTLTALSFALALTARAWGETQPPHPALRGFVEGCEGKPQPCWYGIVPRVMTVDEAKAILSTFGWDFPEPVFSDDPTVSVWIPLTSKDDSFPCPAKALLIQREPNPIVMQINIDDCTIKLGDFVNTFPDNLRLASAYLYTALYQEWNLTAYYDGSLSPYTPIKSLVVAEYERFWGETYSEWNGFMTLAQICRLHPFSGACSM